MSDEERRARAVLGALRREENGAACFPCNAKGTALEDGECWRCEVLVLASHVLGGNLDPRTRRTRGKGG